MFGRYKSGVSGFRQQKRMAARSATKVRVITPHAPFGGNMTVLRHWLLPGMIAIGIGILVLMIGGLPMKWGLLVIVGLMLPTALVFVSDRRRLLEIGLMLSFGLSLDVHLGNDPAHEVDPAGVPVSLTGLLVCGLVGWWAVSRMEDQRPPLQWGGLGWLIVGLWTTSIWSVIGSSEPRFGVYALINMAYYTLMYAYLVNNVTSREHLRLWVSCLMIAIVVTSVVALMQAVFGRPDELMALGMVDKDKRLAIEDTDVMRVGGLMGSANGLATVLVQMLPLLLVYFFNPAAGYPMWLMAAGFGIGLLALVATYSRGGWLAFAVTLMVMIPMMSSSRINLMTRKALKQIALIACLIALLTAPFYGNIIARLTADDRGSAYSRVIMAQVAWRMIRDNPVFGVGLGNYENVMDRYDDGPQYAHKDFRWPVHNIYLNITAEGGLLGGLCFLLLCTMALWMGWQATRVEDAFLRTTAVGLLVGLIGFLLVGMKELGPLGSSLYRWFWLAVGLLAAIRRLQLAGLAGMPAVEAGQSQTLGQPRSSRRKRPARYDWRGLQW